MLNRFKNALYGASSSSDDSSIGSVYTDYKEAVFGKRIRGALTRSSSFREDLLSEVSRTRGDPRADSSSSSTRGEGSSGLQRGRSQLLSQKPTTIYEGDEQYSGGGVNQSKNHRTTTTTTSTASSSNSASSTRAESRRVSNQRGSPSGARIQKFRYTRPQFLQLKTDDEIIVSADHQIRPIILPRDVSRLPWKSGYAECINAGKSVSNEDQAASYQDVAMRREAILQGNSTGSSSGNNGDGGTSSCGDSWTGAHSTTSSILDQIPWTYFGLFDGHAGSAVAVAAAAQLHAIISEKLRQVADLLLALKFDIPEMLEEEEAEAEEAMGEYGDEGGDDDDDAEDDEEEDDAVYEVGCASDSDADYDDAEELAPAPPRAAANGWRTRSKHVDEESMDIVDNQQEQQQQQEQQSGPCGVEALELKSPVGVTKTEIDDEGSPSTSMGGNQSDDRVNTSGGGGEQSPESTATTAAASINHSAPAASAGAEPAPAPTPSRDQSVRRARVRRRAQLRARVKRRSSYKSNDSFLPTRADLSRNNINQDALIKGALESAFWEMDELIARDKHDYRMPGGCAALVSLFILGRLYVCNAGDCRAIVCRRRPTEVDISTSTGASGESNHSASQPVEVVPMSHDFTPVSERRRILRLGMDRPELLGKEFTHLEFVRRPTRLDLGKQMFYRDAYMTGWSLKEVTYEDLKFPLVWGEGKRSRVLATIGVTRGFGDHELRAQYGSVPIKPFLTPEPEVRVLDLGCQLAYAAEKEAEHDDSAGSDAADDGCKKQQQQHKYSDQDVLVMGTDGLWDVASNEEVASIVERSLRPDNELSRSKYRYISAAQDLIIHSRGSQMPPEFNSTAWRIPPPAAGDPRHSQQQQQQPRFASLDDISAFVIPLKAYCDEYLEWARLRREMIEAQRGQCPRWRKRRQRAAAAAARKGSQPLNESARDEHE